MAVDHQVVVDKQSAVQPDYLICPNAVLGDQSAKWRYGRAPDYSKTRNAWKESKSMSHPPGSLSEVVENLVKNWEAEASFKPNLDDWRTIDRPNYSFSVNGGYPQSAEHMLKVGTYNAIIAPNEFYSPMHHDFESSHKTFKRMMPTFAWEVIEVYSGPPSVSFKWRHWGVMKNDYVGFNDKGEKVMAKAHGRPIEVFGVTVAQVDDQVRLQKVETWFDPLEMFRQIVPNCNDLIKQDMASANIGTSLSNGIGAQFSASWNPRQEAEANMTVEVDTIPDIETRIAARIGEDDCTVEVNGTATCPFGFSETGGVDKLVNLESTFDMHVMTNGDQAEDQADFYNVADDSASQKEVTSICQVEVCNDESDHKTRPKFVAHAVGQNVGIGKIELLCDSLQPNNLANTATEPSLFSRWMGTGRLPPFKGMMANC